MSSELTERPSRYSNSYSDSFHIQMRNSKIQMGPCSYLKKIFVICHKIKSSFRCHFLFFILKFKNQPEERIVPGQAYDLPLFWDNQKWPCKRLPPFRPWKGQENCVRNHQTAKNNFKLDKTNLLIDKNWLYREEHFHHYKNFFRIRSAANCCETHDIKRKNRSFNNFLIGFSNIQYTIFEYSNLFHTKLVQPVLNFLFFWQYFLAKT